MHTPTPWAWDRKKSKCKVYQANKENGGPRVIAEFYRDEDADYTVRAVNALEELVDFIKGEWEECCGEVDDGVLCGTCETRRILIANAQIHAASGPSLMRTYFDEPKANGRPA